MDYYEMKRTIELALKLSSRFNSFSLKDGKDVNYIIEKLLEKTFDEISLNENSYSCISFKDNKLLLNLGPEIKDKQKFSIKVLFILFKEFNYPLCNELKADKDYIFSTKNNKWLFNDKQLAELFVCYFLYDDSSFTDLILNVYSKNDKTYSFLEFSKETNLDVEILKLRSRIINLIEFSS